MLTNLINILSSLTFSNMQFSYLDSRNKFQTVDVNDDSTPEDILDGFQECDTVSIFLPVGVSPDSAQELLTELKTVSSTLETMNEFRGRVKVTTNKDNSGTTVSLNREPSNGLHDGSSFAKALELLIS